MDSIRYVRYGKSAAPACRGRLPGAVLTEHGPSCRIIDNSTTSRHSRDLYLFHNTL
jgi:hypothetical protein